VTLSAFALLARTSSAQITQLVSADASGAEGRYRSFDCSISADGRFVAFASDATNLVPGDTNGHTDIFVRDRRRHTIERVSVDSNGAQANGPSWNSSVSPDGRYLAFVSGASNLVPGDTNEVADVFVADRSTGTIERISVDSNGAQAEGVIGSFGPIGLSADGRYVTFVSYATNLVPGDTNGQSDVFVRDRQRGVTERVSVSSEGQQGNGTSSSPSISGDGRYVAFRSGSSNLVHGAHWGVYLHDRASGETEVVCVDGNSPAISADGHCVAFANSEYIDHVGVYVRDLRTGTTELVSADSSGAPTTASTFAPSISADGRYVAFGSYATNLVSGDANGFSDVFVRDRRSATTRLVSIDSNGVQGNGSSGDLGLCISADGREVAFASNASNLVPDSQSWWTQVFVHDASAEIDSLHAPRVTPDELDAISTMRAIAAAQAELKANASIDTNGDGVGEYGYFAELAGTFPVRVSNGGVPAAGSSPDDLLNPALLPAAFGSIRDGFASSSGYLFEMFLPTANAGGVYVSAVSEDLEGGKRHPPFPDPANGAELWCCYAWPIKVSATSLRAYFINQDGVLLQWMNHCYTPYSGAIKWPQFDEAYQLPDMSSPLRVDQAGGNDDTIWTEVWY
jgi:Tol biopolymer transport system component